MRIGGEAPSDRPGASRFGISAQLIDDTLYDAYGQRQVTQYFTQLNTSPVVLEITPELQRDPSSLDQLYVKSPVTGGTVPLTAVVDIDSNKTGPLTVNHQGSFLRSRWHSTCSPALRSDRR
jgi:multidrug efflux pump subunit AcrB